MTRRLVLSYLGLVLLILIGLEIPLGVLAARHEQDITVSQVDTEATGLAAVTSEDVEHGDLSDLDAILGRYQGRTGDEVSIVGPSGTVLAASGPDQDNDAAKDDQGLVAAALAGRAATSFGSDENVPWAVAAVPISGEDHGPAGSDGPSGSAAEANPAGPNQASPNQTEGAVLLGVSAAATVNRIHAIWLALAGFGIGSLVLAGAAGALLARSMSRPLSRLESAVNRFGSGDLGTRAEESGPAEVASLALQFNHMAGRLSELVEAQSRFVADASHQLRSPLTALRLRLENLEIEVPGSSGEGIAAAGREVQRLSRLVDGLLILGRAESVEPERAPLDIETIIEDRCDAWSALAEERRVELVVATERSGHPVAKLVPGDLDQILDNLLANALDASPEGGRIVVSLSRTDIRWVDVSVRDFGPGMSDEDRLRAFDRFWQGSASRRGNSGLGLAIVRQLALRNDATVELRQALPTGLQAVIRFHAADGPERPRAAKEPPGVRAGRS